jgi:hypothetical protein
MIGWLRKSPSSRVGIDPTFEIQIGFAYNYLSLSISRLYRAITTCLCSLKLIAQHGIISCLARSFAATVDWCNAIIIIDSMSSQQSCRPGFISQQQWVAS